MAAQLFPKLSGFKELHLLFSQRRDGSMKVGSNRDAFFKAQGIDPKKVVGADLVHGKGVSAVSDAQQGTTIDAMDSLITNSPGTFLAITVADCLPIFFYDPERRAIGLAHAGWRGLVAGIAAETVEAMVREFGIQPADLHVAIGPSICFELFEVRDEVAQQFSAFSGTVVSKSGSTYVDLKLVAQQQLASVGVRSTNIETSDACTYCDEDRYFSFRRDKPEELEAMVAAIGIRKM